MTVLFSDVVEQELFQHGENYFFKQKEQEKNGNKTNALSMSGDEFWFFEDSDEVEVI
jgi:hypothetical protein